MNYIPTIGLEIHAELRTKTKMFCNSKNDPDETRPNVNICPVCMGHPGTLPTINKKAVEHVLTVGVAVGGQLADFTEFDRKNYFYPDIPKGYQISQYKYPLVSGGSIGDVELTRIHLEEDTALSKHRGNYSLIDFNRAGIPLMELVTEPVIHSAEEAVAFAKEFQLLLRYLGVSDANMEKGELRLEANISVAPTPEIANRRESHANQRRYNQRESASHQRTSADLGTKVEIKNLNSFKAVERGITYEVKRQTALLEGGSKVVQETRGWDENKQKTFSQRTKEGSADYRYFPEPDLPKLKINELPEFKEDVLKKKLPRLPWEAREWYRGHGLNDTQVDLFVSDRELAGFFDEAAEHLSDEERKLAANYIASDIAGLRVADPEYVVPPPEHFAELVVMATKGDVSSRGVKELLKVLSEYKGGVRTLAEEKGLLQKSDEGELKKIAEHVIGENKEVAEEYKAGKEEALKFLIGQGMKATKGAANPQVLSKLLRRLLDK